MVYYYYSCYYYKGSSRPSRPKQSQLVYPIGTDVQLRCPVYSNSDHLFVEWRRYKDNKILGSSRHVITLSGLLKIKSVSSEDSGIYICKAFNAFGSIKANVTLQVVKNNQFQLTNTQIDNSYPNDDDDYVIIKSNFNNDHMKKMNEKKSEKLQNKVIQLNKPKGSTVRLKCDVNSRNIKWFRDGRLILNVPQISFGSRTRRNIIYLYNVDVNDSGNYTCSGDGQNGQTKASFILNVFGKKIS